MAKKHDIELGGDRRSLDRPGWTSADLHAYRHKHGTRRNGLVFIVKDYYVKSRGLC